MCIVIVCLCIIHTLVRHPVNVLKGSKAGSTKGWRREGWQGCRLRWFRCSSHAVDEKMMQTQIRSLPGNSLLLRVSWKAKSIWPEGGGQYRVGILLRKKRERTVSGITIDSWCTTRRERERDKSVFMYALCLRRRQELQELKIAFVCLVLSGRKKSLISEYVFPLSSCDPSSSWQRNIQTQTPFHARTFLLHMFQRILADNYFRREF